MTELKKMYLVGGGKGGVGKSLATMAALHHMEQLGLVPHLIETDTSNPDVAKAYQAAPAPGRSRRGTVPTELIDLDVEDGWLELLNRCAELQAHSIVVSTGARNGTAVSKYGELLAAGLEELEMQLVVLWMIDSNRDCLELLRQFRQIFPNARIHVLRNEHCARSFDMYDGSELRRAIEESGGHSFTFPKLAERVTVALNQSRMTLAEGAGSAELPFGHQAALKKWLREVGPLFAQVAG
jgi:hypothetical protein